MFSHFTEKLINKYNIKEDKLTAANIIKIITPNTDRYINNSSFKFNNMDNVYLPNNAYITYKFGARSYISNLYSEYTWRNGIWYKIYNNLHFSNNEIIDDTYIPIFLNGIRIFIKKINNGKYKVFIPASNKFNEINEDILNNPAFKIKYEESFK